MIYKICGADGAVFSDDMKYRYELWRGNSGSGTLAMVMLNPSIGTECVNSKTLDICLGIMKSLKYSRLVIGNLFAYRSQNPDVLYKVPNPVGVDNNAYLSRIAKEGDMLIYAWGNHGALNGHRCKEVINLLSAYHPKCLGLTSLEQPRHPLSYKSHMHIVDFCA